MTVMSYLGALLGLPHSGRPVKGGLAEEVGFPHHWLPALTASFLTLSGFQLLHMLLCVPAALTLPAHLTIASSRAGPRGRCGLVCLGLPTIHCSSKGSATHATSGRQQPAAASQPAAFPGPGCQLHVQQPGILKMRLLWLREDYVPPECQGAGLPAAGEAGQSSAVCERSYLTLVMCDIIVL